MKNRDEYNKIKTGSHLTDRTRCNATYGHFISSMCRAMRGILMCNLISSNVCNMCVLSKKPLGGRFVTLGNSATTSD